MVVVDKASNRLTADFTEIVRFEVEDSAATVKLDVNEDGKINILDLVIIAKAFGTENDRKGDLKIHTINGRHPGEHYTGDLFNAYYQKMSKEIPFFINNTSNRIEQDNIYIVILGGVDVVAGVGSTWGRAWDFRGGALGGTAIVSENFEKLYPNHFTSIIYHEFGHTLLLEHTQVDNSLMGLLPVGGPSHMEDFEARLINENHFFNDDHILNPPPEINENLQVTAVGMNTIRFSFKIKGSTNLYHAQLKRGKDYTISK